MIICQNYYLFLKFNYTLANNIKMKKIIILFYYIFLLLYLVLKLSVYNNICLTLEYD
jgi:hypothetical protein